MPDEITLTEAPRLLVAAAPDINRTLISRLLQRRGYNVAEAGDGVSALECVASWRPDLVLLGLRLNDISGVEILRLLRRDYDSVQLPIIIVAAKREVAEAARCFDAGANDYIVMPIQWPILHARLTTHLRLHTAYAELSGAAGQFLDMRV